MYTERYLIMKKTENNKLIADFMGYKTDEYGMYSKENGRGFFKKWKEVFFLVFTKVILRFWVSCFIFLFFL